MSTLRAVLVLLLLLPSPGLAAGGDAITAVRSDGTLEGPGGDAMRLARLRLPAGLGPAAASLQGEAVALLREACLHQAVSVVRLGVDRWRRPLVTIGTDQGDVEHMLLARGLAVVEPRAHLGGDLAPLFAAEDAARRHNRGLWAEALRVYAADAVPLEGFGIVEGTVVSAARVGGRIYVNFGTDYKIDFTVVAEGDTLRALQAGTPKATALAGYRVRARGMLEEWNGPLVRLAGPGAMEILSAPLAAP